MLKNILKRRSVIKGAGALAALTVAGANAVPLAKTKKVAESRIAERIASGVISDEIFYLNRTMVISIDNLTFVNCRFIAMSDMDYMVHILAKNTFIKNCYFDGNNAKGCLLFNSQL